MLFGSAASSAENSCSRLQGVSQEPHCPSHKQAICFPLVLTISSFLCKQDYLWTAYIPAYLSGIISENSLSIVFYTDLGNISGSHPLKVLSLNFHQGNWESMQMTHFKHFYLKIRVIFQTLSSAKPQYVIISPSAHCLDC